MLKLVDIAARTGQPPVRALLSLAVGSSDTEILLTHEIRYRNDQFRAIYGLYEGDSILGIVGLARYPSRGTTKILHMAVAGQPSDRTLARTLVARALSEQLQQQIHWGFADEYEDVASELGFRPTASGIWKLDRRH